MLNLPEQPIYVNGDPIRLEQIVLNLLENAAKYTDPGGRISLSLEQQDDEAILTVRDTGIGLAPETLHTIFDLFTQVNGSLDRSGGGLGIGLNLVRQSTGIAWRPDRGAQRRAGPGHRVRRALARQPNNAEPIRLPQVPSPAEGHRFPCAARAHRR